MATVIMYSTAYCPFCVRARDLLDSKNITYQDIRIDEQPSKREEMIAKSKRRTVPQIFINNQPIGGCDDLYALEHQGQLDNLLSNEEIK
jgi:glutaredoxin 3